ncbi:MAG: deoxyguanosinetriphosphate triphosphohydrolase [Vicinamibacteria bacterium]
MPDRAFFEERERKLLASYAASSASSRGRRHAEAEHRFRTAFQRDRDRIIHSTAFRRLEYKTQVFVNHEGDHYRTRLTHSLEAAQIARTMARYLRLNEDLTEAVTLSHDLGHTPFGHAGEEAMNALMADHGGFEHNLQSLRIVDHIEKRYPDFRGLNLSFEVREGIFKHSPRSREEGPEEFLDRPNPTLEAQLVDLADEIAYINHDLEDGLTSGLLELSALEEVDLWRKHFEEASREFPKETPKMRIRITIRKIIDHLTTELIAETERLIATGGIESTDDVARHPERLVRFTPEVETAKATLKRFQFQNLYRHFRVVRMAEKAKRVVRDLFHAYDENPRQLPPHIALRIDDEGLPRVVCDYIAGMTDRFALDEHRKLFDPLVRL